MIWKLREVLMSTKSKALNVFGGMSDVTRYKDKPPGNESISPLKALLSR